MPAGLRLQPEPVYIGEHIDGSLLSGPPAWLQVHRCFARTCCGVEQLPAMFQIFRQFVRFLSAPKLSPATSWDSTVAAASEEWADPTEFDFRPELKYGQSVQGLVERIIGEARSGPNQKKLVHQITVEFGLSERDSLTAIDRVLGGIVRAAAMNPNARPDFGRDPVASVAFVLAAEDTGVIDDIFPGWRTWPPGAHSA
jgi:hypothetical protein